MPQFFLDIPDTGQMLIFTNETLARQAYSQTLLPCALYKGEQCIAEKELVDTGLDYDGNAIMILEEQEQDGDEYVSIEDEALIV